MKIFLVAGEPSGDLLGGRLMAAIKRLDPAVAFCGVGGARMEEQGLRSLFPMRDLTLMGLAELFPKIPLILRRLRETVAAIKQAQPDVVVTIDAPDFCFRVAKKFVGSNIKFVHYVAPTVWAWRAGRAKKIQPLFKHLLALFPFEPPYFQTVGLPCSFVGHPLIEAGISAAESRPFHAKYNLAENVPLLVVLPGSRRSELSALLDVFGETVRRIHAAHPEVRVVLPTLPHYAERLAALTEKWPGSPIICTSDADKYSAFKAATAALAASGTVALELGLAGTPAVIAYKVNAFTFAVYRRLIKVKFANLVNIMAGRMAVPEFIQHDCTPDKIAPALDALLSDETQRATQKEVLAQVGPWLTAEGLSPSDKAAQVVVSIATLQALPERQP